MGSIRIARSTTSALLVLSVLAPTALAQRGGRGGPPAPAEDSAPIDLTGYWVSVATEDWKFRMVTPNPGAYDALTLNAAGLERAREWDPEADDAAGLACRGYGAPAIMRLAGRFHITWSDPDTLRIDTDYGSQTRLIHFRDLPPAGDPTWQGRSVARWEPAPGGGSLTVETDNLRMGYVRKNGAPYSDQTVMTEFYDLHRMPNGDEWMTITTIVDDPVYFSRPLITTTDLKRLSDDEGWNPTPCSVD